MDENELRNHISATPPTCVKLFRLSPVNIPEQPSDYFKTVWSLACRCGDHKARLLGYDLRDLKPGYTGSTFVSPLGFDCASCRQVTEILDTQVHGYHAEVAKIEGGTGSSKIRGTGERKAFACPHCNHAQFTITVGFVYWDFDLLLDEPELPGEEFFNEFLMHCSCANCAYVSQPTAFGKL